MNTSLLDNFQKPWCLIDSFTYRENEILSKKYVSYSDFFLLGHFKEYSVFPGMLMIEGLLQSIEVANNKNLLNTNNHIPTEIQSRFLHPVFPGDIIHYSIIVEKDYENKLVLKGIGKVNQRIVMKAKFTFQKGVKDGD
ncbi:hypothetical protein [Bacillus sp. SM2101]|uniref:hypothetical protein n=1 Tax=Bacillus sp. SM2101 TaxID=2805366 RepID=UPI001BDE6C00|nr:hypothetical protein [Bacillus sp. SM2101]